jgi:hypothetical protein
MRIWSSRVEGDAIGVRGDWLYSIGHAVRVTGDGSRGMGYGALSISRDEGYASNVIEL